MSAPAPDLGATLRAWRDRTPPGAVGLPTRRSQRASGLRREDLAELAGISVDYVVRLEQGRATSPSAQVVAALARALQLTTAERDHLHRLAGLAPPSAERVVDHVPPGLSRVLTRLGDTAAVGVFAADWRLLRWNRGWAALFGDPSSVPPAQRSFARAVFAADGDGPRIAQWPVVSSDSGAVEVAVVSDLRRATGRFPRDALLRAEVAALRERSPRFAELWAAGAVGAHREDHKVVQHPAVGPISVDCDVLLDGDAELKVVVLTAAPGTEDETRLQLALVSGAPQPAHS